MQKISGAAATAVGLGAIIGAGIFVLSGTAIALAGPYALLAFILVGIIVFIVALELGELASIMPNAKGASYSYVYKAFGSELGFITGIMMYFSYATSISVIALGFGSYLSSILGLQSASYSIPFAILLIAALAGINALGIKKAARADLLLVVVKIAILVTFIAFAFYISIRSGGFGFANFEASPAQLGIAQIFAASIAIIFAYSGFQNIATFTSRVEGGPRSAARAIMGAVLISMVLYVMVVIALMLLAPASSYKIGGDPLAFALKSANAPSWLLLLTDIGALIATASASLAMILGSSRLLYQISSDGLLPKILRKYDAKRDVAVRGVAISAIIGAGMLFAGNIYIIAAISNFGLLFSYLMRGFAVVHFRSRRTYGDFKVPFYPYPTLIAIIGILAFMAGMPREALAVGVVLMLSLLTVYYLLREVEGKKVIRIRLFR
jgi:APA family basic amino acid/polyamine antiporter